MMYTKNVPREKKTTMLRISFLRSVPASIVLAKKASIARRHGLKPANRPAAKTAMTAGEAIERINNSIIEKNKITRVLYRICIQHDLTDAKVIKGSYWPFTPLCLI